jgi:hypothetical protein
VPASEAIVRSLPPRLVENVQVSSFRGEDAGEAVDRALRLGVPHGAIYLRAAIVAIGQTRDQVNSVLTIEVRGWDVALRVPEVDVYLMTFDEAGAPLGSTRFTPADATQISKAADWRWHGGIRVPNETKRVGVAVLDRRSGVLGAVHLVFELALRAWSAAGGEPAMRAIPFAVR